MRFLSLALKTLRLAMIRIGVGWMFALLTFNFNRISIYELGAVGVVVTTLIGLHHFLAPFQVMFGRLADRYPILGYRRSPYILLSGLIASLVFVLLPTLALGLGAGSVLAVLLAFVLLTIFGLAIAANGTAINALVAETTSDRERGAVVAVVWTFLILSSIASAQVAKVIMPVYDPQQMQFLYNLTPGIVIGTLLIGLIGLERRISPEAHAALLEQDVHGPAGPEVHTQTNVIKGTWRMLMHNRQVRGFFVFILLAIMGIFLQDAILEVFGAEVFGMEQGETATFQQTWGGGVLLGMLLIGLLSTRLPISKKSIATFGGMGIALGLALLAGAGWTMRPTLINPALLLMGLGTGAFNVGALSMMMEMTVEGHIGLYMGLWGMAQGLGNGLANVLSGALHTLLIETTFLIPAHAYTFIFSFEALMMVLAVGVLRGISVQEFKGLSSADVQTVMAFDTVG